MRKPIRNLEVLKLIFVKRGSRGSKEMNRISKRRLS